MAGERAPDEVKVKCASACPPTEPRRRLGARRRRLWIRRPSGDEAQWGEGRLIAVIRQTRRVPDITTPWAVRRTAKEESAGKQQLNLKGVATEVEGAVDKRLHTPKINGGTQVGPASATRTANKRRHGQGG